MEKNRAILSQETQKISQESSLFPFNETEMSISDVPTSPAKKICTSMSQEQRETPQESSLIPSNETDISISEVSISPAKKIRTSMSQLPLETTDQGSCFSPSKETELVLFGVSMTPGKKSQTSKSQEQRETPKDSSFLPSKETEKSISDVSISPEKKIRTSMSQQPREATQDSSVLPSKETEFCLFGVSMTLGKKSQTRKRQEQEQREIPQEYLFLASKEMKMPLTGILISPAKIMSQQPREIPKEYLFFPSKEMSLSSASPMNTVTDEDSKKTDCLEDPEKGFVSVRLCLYDETWLDFPNITWSPGNLDDPNITCAPRDEELSKQEARKIKEMRFHSKEQKEEEKQYGVSTELTLFTDPWTIKKELNKTNTLYLSNAVVESHILKYLSDDDQKNKVRQGDGMTVNVYDSDTHTTHQMLLRWKKNRKRYGLKNSWRNDFVSRRDLKIGDKVGFFWDHFHSTLNFRVLSRAIAD